MNPYEYGECFLTDDGAETDLDLGHYERFLNQSTTQANNVTTGKIYQTVIIMKEKVIILVKQFKLFPILQMKSKDEFNYWIKKKIMILLSQKSEAL